MLFPRLSLLLLALAFALAATPAGAQLPASAPTFAAAQARAKADDRLLFVLFKSADCKQCRKFQKDVLDAETFQTFARDHLSLMIYDVDAYAALPESERALALSLEEKYGVEQMPAIVVYAPDGQTELLRTQGYRGTPAPTIVAQLKAKLPR
ncbi:MAG: thioredoxin family protein [Verrucomicrobiales bacterium]|nr:thioredoxin family protein [Verrucomicrobiales bacterium]